MPNYQDSTKKKQNEINSSDFSSGARKSQTFQGDDYSQSGASGSGDGAQIEQIMSYIKTNWRMLLAELVAAGVTAYLSHGRKKDASESH